MATDLENLQTVKTQVIARLVEITAEPKPSYSIDGQSISWSDYFSALTNQLEKLNELIALEGGPFEYRTQGVT